MQIHIARVNGILYHGDADALTVPGVEGELTVLKGHVPIVTTLKPGRLVILRDGEEVFTHEVAHGILEVTGSAATVLL